MVVVVVVVVVVGVKGERKREGKRSQGKMSVGELDGWIQLDEMQKEMQNNVAAEMLVISCFSEM